LIRAEHPSIGLVRVLGHDVWLGWVMLAALVYSVVPPIVLGRMKQPLARQLHEKTLHADAVMNKADWMTGGAAAIGVLGVGLGFWWADAVAAGVIALDVTYDGIVHVRRAMADLMDQRPTDVDYGHSETLEQQIVDRLEQFPWV